MPRASYTRRNMTGGIYCHAARRCLAAGRSCRVRRLDPKRLPLMKTDVDRAQLLFRTIKLATQSTQVTFQGELAAERAVQHAAPAGLEGFVKKTAQ